MLAGMRDSVYLGAEEIKMGRKEKIYALYKGEDLLADGTLREIAEKMGVKVETVRFYQMPTYQKRGKTVSGNKRVLVCLDD